MSTKNTGYDVSSKYIASDQWMQACISEEFTYEEYCESARNNEKVVGTTEEFQDCRKWVDEAAYFERWPDLTPDLNPNN